MNFNEMKKSELLDYILTNNVAQLKKDNDALNKMLSDRTAEANKYKSRLEAAPTKDNSKEIKELKDKIFEQDVMIRELLADFSNFAQLVVSSAELANGNIKKTLSMKGGR